MKKPEPKCPYCGENMELWWKRTGNRSYTGYFDCKNIMCRANGPIVSEGNRQSMEQSAISAALSRPLQKPLTLHELLEMIGPGLEAVTYCEGKSFGQTYATIWIGGRVIDALGIEPKENISFDSYGKTWRAWAARPTDEERAAAQWEE